MLYECSKIVPWIAFAVRQTMGPELRFHPLGEKCNFFHVSHSGNVLDCSPELIQVPGDGVRVLRAFSVDEVSACICLVISPLTVRMLFDPREEFGPCPRSLSGVMCSPVHVFQVLRECLHCMLRDVRIGFPVFSVMELRVLRDVRDLVIEIPVRCIVSQLRLMLYHGLPEVHVALSDHLCPLHLCSPVSIVRCRGAVPVRSPFPTGFGL